MNPEDSIIDFDFTYWRFGGWCWRKPIWIGLPLYILAFLPLGSFDIGRLIFYILLYWGRHKD